MTFLDWFAVWYIIGLLASTFWTLKAYWVEEPIAVPAWGLFFFVFLAMVLGPIMFPVGYFGYKYIRRGT